MKVYPFFINSHVSKGFDFCVLFQAFVATLALAASALADNAPAPYRPAPTPAYNPAPAPYRPAPSYNEPKYEDTPAVYDFGYAVNDDYAGVNFNANENRNNYDTTGKYSVLLPDGRTQTVTYTVNAYDGYVADVQYDGYAKEYVPAPKPAPFQSLF